MALLTIIIWWISAKQKVLLVSSNRLLKLYPNN